MPVETFGIFQKTGFPQRSKIRLAFFCGIRYNKMNQYVCMKQNLWKAGAPGRFSGEMGSDKREDY